MVRTSVVDSLLEMKGEPVVTSSFVPLAKLACLAASWGMPSSGQRQAEAEQKQSM